MSRSKAPFVASAVGLSCLAIAAATLASPHQDRVDRAAGAVLRVTSRARLVPRAKALAAALRLEALAQGTPDTDRSIAALYERLYRVHREPSDLEAARAHLARLPGCPAALGRAQLLAESATDLRAAWRELTAVATRFAPDPCADKAIRAAAVLAAFGVQDPAAVPLTPSAPAVRAAASSEVPAPTERTTPASAAATPTIDRIALWPDGPSTRVAIYIDHPCPFLQQVDRGGLRVRIPGASLSRLVPAERPSAIGIVRAIRARRSDDGVDVTLEVAGAVRYRVFPMAEPYRIVVDVARPEIAPAITGIVRPTVHRIVVDAGHGGHDPGARGASTGIDEKAVTLEVATLLGRLLTERLGVEVVYTRPDDRFVALEERTALANGAGADLFVSIHANAAQSPDQSGIETFVLARSNERDALKVAARENRTEVSAVNALGALLATLGLESHQAPSEVLARSIQDRLLRRMRARFGEVNDRGVRKAMFYVLVGAHMPAVLVETSFLTNPVEEARLATPAFRRELAEGIYEGIAAFMRGTGEESTGNVLQEP